MDEHALVPERAILIVEDDSTQRRALMRSLAAYRTHAVASAEEALERLLGDEPLAAAVIDIGLPGMSGLDLLEQIRATRPTLPVVLLTAMVDRESINRACRLGAWYLCKPVTATELAQVVSQVHLFEVHPPLAELSALIVKHGLSRRESQVLSLALEGLRRDVIRSRLGIRETTVKKTVARLLRKCGATSLREIESNLA
jgi:DNA-binding NarL/FixJ family response regulator